MCHLKLSIIIPVYNVEKYIARCLDSIFNQNIDDACFEVIVVNDGTPDNSMQIVESYVTMHRNLTVINQDNQGLSVARNTGLAKASGDYVWFVDSDDWLVKDAFSILFGYMKGHPSIISSPLIASYENEKNNWNQFNIESTRIVPSAEYLVRYPVGAVQRYVIKRSLLASGKLKFYPGIYHEDAEFAPRLLFKSNSVLFIKEPLYHYYQRVGSIMSSWKTKNTQDYLFVVNQLNLFQQRIEDFQYKSALDVFVLKILLRAFPYNQIGINREIKNIFYSAKAMLRHRAVKVFFLKRISFKFRVLSFLTLLNPTLALYMLKKKES